MVGVPWCFLRRRRAGCSTSRERAPHKRSISAVRLGLGGANQERMPELRVETAEDPGRPAMPRAASEAFSTGATGRSSCSTASWNTAPVKALRTPGRRVRRLTSSRGARVTHRARCAQGPAAPMSDR